MTTISMTRRPLVILAAFALAGCGASAAQPEGTLAGSKSEQSTGDTSPGRTVGHGTDPGVSAFHGLRREALPDNLEDVTTSPVIEGTVTAERFGRPDGEIDSFMTVRILTVQVDNVVNGSLSGATEVEVESGVYEWRSNPGRLPSSADAERLTASGQPWLSVGDQAFLILKELDNVDRHEALEAAGTYRIVNGKLDAKPRTEEIINSSELIDEIAGETPEAAAEKIDAAG